MSHFVSCKSGTLNVSNTPVNGYLAISINHFPNSFLITKVGKIRIGQGITDKVLRPQAMAGSAVRPSGGKTDVPAGNSSRDAMLNSEGETDLLSRAISVKSDQSSTL